MKVNLKTEEEILQFLTNGGLIQICESKLDDFYNKMKETCIANKIQMPEVVEMTPFDSIYIIEYDEPRRKIRIISKDLYFSPKLKCIVEWEDLPEIFRGSEININIKEKDKMLKILEIYEEKKVAEIERKYDKQLEELEANDPVTVCVKQAEDTLKEMLNTENLRLIVNGDVLEYTQETIDKRKEIINTIKNEKRTLKDQISEIEALLELAPNYEEKVQILKDYGIMDKKKNVIL